MPTCRHCHREVRNPLLVNNLPYCNSECRMEFTRNWKDRRPKPEPPKPHPMTLGDPARWTLWDWERFVRARAEGTLASVPIGDDDV